MTFVRDARPDLLAREVTDEDGWWIVVWPNKKHRVLTSFRVFAEAQELLQRLGAGTIVWGKELP